MTPKLENPSADPRKQMTRRRLFFDWAQLVIALFVPLAIIVYTVMQNNTEILIARENRVQDLKIADERHDQDIMLAEDEQEEATLVHYFDSLGKLLEKDDKLENQTNIARFKTLTALAQLKAKRKGLLIRSLIENKLIIMQNKRDVILDLSLADLTGLDLTHNMLVNDEMTCAYLSQTTLTNASFRGMGLHGSTFEHTHLANSDFSSSYNYAWSCGGTITGVDFRGAILDNSNFNNALHRKSIFAETWLDYARMRRFKCYDCSFFNASMVSTDLSYAQFLSDSNLKTTFQRVDMYSTLLYKTNFTHIDFAVAKLTMVNATETIFHDCHFIVASLQNNTFVRATFTNSSFVRVSLSGSSWYKTNISYTSFDLGDMTNVNFIDSACHYCHFNQTDLTGTNFTNSSLDGSDFRLTNVNYQQLFVARSLQGVLFPNEPIFQKLKK